MKEINERKKAWDKLNEAYDSQYLSNLRAIDPSNIGIKLKCPKCNAISWIRLTKKRNWHNSEIHISCYAACGYHGSISEFSPVSCSRNDAGNFDFDTVCKSYGSEYAFNGFVHRCPVCHIENPRDVMKALVNKTKSSIENDPSKENLKSLLYDIVSTFDGVMKRCYEICMINRRETNYKTPSFQNLIDANEKLTDLINLEEVVDDWTKLIRIFQKRHLYTHSLGVVDKRYIDKTGDNSTPIGSQASLTEEEIMYAAISTEKIVIHFFGHHLS